MIFLVSFEFFFDKWCGSDEFGFFMSEYLCRNCVIYNTPFKNFASSTEKSEHFWRKKKSGIKNGDAKKRHFAHDYYYMDVGTDTFYFAVKIDPFYIYF